MPPTPERHSPLLALATPKRYPPLLTPRVTLTCSPLSPPRGTLHCSPLPLQLVEGAQLLADLIASHEQSMEQQQAPPGAAGDDDFSGEAPLPPAPRVRLPPPPLLVAEVAHP